MIIYTVFVLFTNPSDLIQPASLFLPETRWDDEPHRGTQGASRAIILNSHSPSWYMYIQKTPISRP